MCDRLVYLLGLIKNLQPAHRQFVSIAQLLVKRRVDLHWGSRVKPTKKSWLSFMTYCKTQLELYVKDLPRALGPKEIWGPLKTYLVAHTEKELLNVSVVLKRLVFWLTSQPLVSMLMDNFQEERAPCFGPRTTG
ncbi:hypothetical protein NDU88_005479 [Pleurodeles waltl]|uniref:Uncharacterized protein n=1 Tax=Pleurodeles waltl TaxID=8319 RepID=A0AAV7UI55_PLEWA|nr:hypothetical protein NDU88_005479 [Pleurodeles waltl]